ncbi:MAG: efflux RND transporter permease subunit [Saprospiraceae bacterium]|nr:efflux RND transporter permease subunit [Lewinella sp.]
MLRFLLHRPVAVLMTTLGLCVLGLVVMGTLPIGLLPDIAIPRISVQVDWPDRSAQEVEDAIVQPLRNRLLQVGRLTDLQSESRNGSAGIQLSFSYGTNTDLAFIEVNEQIDQISGQLPREVARPRVVKANVSDLPVFYLSMVPRAGEGDRRRGTDPLELSEFARSVVKRRLEQLPEVAFVDLSGLAEPEVRIVPDRSLLQSLGMKPEDITTALEQNNLQLGNILLQDGQYQYAIRFSSRLQTVEDINNIYLTAGEKHLRLGEVAAVSLISQAARGHYRFQAPGDEPPGRRSIVLSVRKQADARLFDLQTSFATLLTDLRQSYPQLDFYVTNDQSDLLRVSISNLLSSLLYGAVFAFLILLVFFREWRAPILIAVVIPVALVITMFGLYLAHISINIISLAGLILGVGLMVDNAIIVIENIRQQRRLGLSLDEACIQGGEEVIRPLLSSALTTCSVFVPLVFLSGLSGALFYDQAVSITLALGASLLVAYLFLPVLVRLLERKRNREASIIEQEGWIQRARRTPFARSVAVVLRYPYLFLLFVLLFLAIGGWLLSQSEREIFPTLTRPGLEMDIDWNAAISLQANEERLGVLLLDLDSLIDSVQVFSGEQDFLMSEWEQQINEARLYVFPRPGINVEHLRLGLIQWMSRQYPSASAHTVPIKNIFDQVFAQDRPALVAHIQQVNERRSPAQDIVAPIVEELHRKGWEPTLPTRQEQYAIRIRRTEALRYEVDYQTVYDRLLALFNENRINTLQTGQQAIPIVLGDARGQSIFGLLEKASVRNRTGDLLPLRYFVEVDREEDYKSIAATRNGVAYDLAFAKYAPELETSIRELVSTQPDLTVQFSGTAFESQRQIRELLVILGIALLLLYLILAAQFESLLQPLIVMLTVPVGIAGAVSILWLAGQTLNLIAIIGMTVMSGIVVNDAILKIDMINRLRQQGFDLLSAIHGGGHRRLRPILMTSLTTIFALLPVLFTSGLGAELQRPLAWAIIGGLSVGTAASLYLLPVLYFLLNSMPGRKDPHFST